MENINQYILVSNILHVLFIWPKMLSLHRLFRIFLVFHLWTDFKKVFLTDGQDKCFH